MNTNTTPPAPDRARSVYRNEFVAGLDAADARYAAAAAAAAEANAEYDAAGDKFLAACAPHLAKFAAAKAAAEAECRAACAPHLADRRADRYRAADKYYADIAALTAKPNACSP